MVLEMTISNQLKDNSGFQIRGRKTSLLISQSKTHVVGT